MGLIKEKKMVKITKIAKRQKSVNLTAVGNNFRIEILSLNLLHTFIFLGF